MPDHPIFDARQSRRAFFLIFVAIMATSLGQSIVFVVLPFLGRGVGFQEIQVGIIITASSIIYSIASTLWGRISEAWGRKQVMIIGLLGYTFGTLLFVSTFWLGFRGLLTGLVLFGACVVARMLQSTVMAATNPAATAYIADITSPENRTRGIARIGAAHAAGTILGPAAGAGLVAVSLLLPLYMAAALTLVTALVIAIFLPHSPYRRNQESPHVSLKFSDTRYRHFLLIGVVMYLVFAMVQQTVGYFYQDTLSLSDQEAARLGGYGFILSAICSFSAQAIVVQRMRLSPKSLIASGLPVMLVGFVLLLLFEDVWVLTPSLGIIGFGMGMVTPGFSSATSLSVDGHEQGAVAGLVSSVPGLGFIIGPILGTGLYQWDHRLPYVTVLVILFCLIMFVLWQKKKWK